MTEFKRDQRVRVTIETKVERVYGDGRITFYVPPAGAGRYLTVDTVDDTLGVTVEVMDPPNWPPQVGDVWEADGLDFYVRQYQGARGRIAIEPFERDSRPAVRYTDSVAAVERDSLDSFKALNPVLVRRRGQ
jgi:hypothetical protein